ncbi:hypothetical protein EV586_102246 [Tumebacillus sp. BK434]|uniref:hypothetical protein n=1 Tax=Tumebacillus sp. BK434 TaxID=2512169 RepID=UPI00104A4F1B|nr:hypothetical protein [Tumebacillus sp. BK434]TCP57801.1 hypothetical protein EV586_102246 [Tumebacillus sp. BK434]
MKKVLLIAAAIIFLNFFLIAGEDARTTSTTAQVIVTAKTPGGPKEPYRVTVQNQTGQQTELTVERNVWNLVDPAGVYQVNYTQEGDQPAVLTAIARAVMAQTSPL